MFTVLGVEPVDGPSRIRAALSTQPVSRACCRGAASAGHPRGGVRYAWKRACGSAGSRASRARGCAGFTRGLLGAAVLA
jgi:hypothetical protein